MSNNISKCSLFLCPTESTFILENISQLVTHLQKNELISTPVTTLDNSFFIGERFFDYIAYLGCSPTVQFEAGEAHENSQENFCHIKVHQYKSEKLIVSQIQSRHPHCPNCKKPVKNWAINKTEKDICCDHCHTTATIGQFNWRKMAGYARVFIEVTDIFPKEAIPQQILLDHLSNACKTDWMYFYSCQ